MGGLISLFKKIPKYTGIGYLVLTSLFGSLVLSWPIVVVGYNAFYAPPPMDIQLPNGFIMGTPPRIDGVREYGEMLFDAQGKRRVEGEVLDVMWADGIVYGQRRRPSGERTFYICEASKNCAAHQNYDWPQFEAIIAEKNLPAYHWRKASTHQHLVWRQAESERGWWLLWPFREIDYGRIDRKKLPTLR